LDVRKLHESYSALVNGVYESNATQGEAPCMVLMGIWTIDYNSKNSIFNGQTMGIYWDTIAICSNGIWEITVGETMYN